MNNDEWIWHDWFAWFPVRIDSGDLIWFQTVQRKKVFESPISYYPDGKIIFRYRIKW